jgi:uncharacterized protein (DUF488 family)
MLYTTGYEGRSLEQFLAALQAAGIRCVADIREAPISRKAGFSKTALAQALQEAGIDYRHVRALGCPRPIRDAYKMDGDWTRYTREFMAYLAQQGPVVEGLAYLANQQSTALMCFEADHHFCHRAYVARALRQRNGLEIRHITATGVIADDP